MTIEVQEAPRRRFSRRASVRVRQERLSGAVVVRWVVVTIIVLWVVLPIVPLLISAFSFRWAFPDLLPASWTLRGWRYIMSPASKVMPSIWTTVSIAAIVTSVSLLIAIPAGRALGMNQFRGKRFVEFLILAPVIVPGFAATLGIHIVFIRLDLAGTIWGVVLVHLIPVTPYAVMVMSGVFANYDVAYEEQARSLGASWLKTMRYVMLPAIFPGLVVAGLFAFLISWGQYILTLIIGGGQVTTLPLLLLSFSRSGDSAVSGALSIIFLLPAILVLIMTSRYVTGEESSVGGFGQR